MFNMDEDQTLMQTLLLDTDKDEMTITLIDTKGNLNLIRGKNDSAAFLPFSQIIGGNDRRVGNIDSSSRHVECLMPQ